MPRRRNWNGYELSWKGYDHFWKFIILISFKRFFFKLLIALISFTEIFLSRVELIKWIERDQENKFSKILTTVLEKYNKLLTNIIYIINSIFFLF